VRTLAPRIIALRHLPRMFCHLSFCLQPFVPLSTLLRTRMPRLAAGDLMSARVGNNASHRARVFAAASPPWASAAARRTFSQSGTGISLTPSRALLARRRDHGFALSIVKTTTRAVFARTSCFAPLRSSSSRIAAVLHRTPHYRAIASCSSCAAASPRGLCHVLRLFHLLSLALSTCFNASLRTA
jgi:hypothetical protein